MNVQRKKIPYQDRTVQFKLRYPIYKTNRLHFSFVKRVTLGQKQFHSNKKWVHYLNHYGSLNLSYDKRYFQAFSSHQKINLRTNYDVIHIQKDTSNYKTYLTGGSHFLFSQNLGKEFFFSTMGSIRRGLWNRKARRIFNNETESFLFNFHSFKQTVQNFNQIHFNIQKVLNQSLYPIYIPFALSRWAPFTGVSFVSFNDKTSSEGDDHYLLNTYVGGIFELIANYKANVYFSISLGYVWKWENRFRESKPQLHGEVYLTTQL